MFKGFIIAVSAAAVRVIFKSIHLLSCARNSLLAFRDLN